MNRNSEYVGNERHWEAGRAGEVGNWFAVFGDVDDFIFYDNALPEEEEPRSTR